MKVVCVVFALCLFVASRATAAEDPVAKAFPNCASHKHLCIIQHSPGGVVDDFKAAAKAVLAGAVDIVVIDGRCASACALFADMVRKNPQKICITPPTIFAFHKAYKKRKEMVAGEVQEVAFDFHNPKGHTPGVTRFVKSHGGFPKAWGDDMLTMPAEAALHFWRACTPNDLPLMNMP